MNKSVKLNSGYEMPAFGLGTWKSEPNKVGEAVRFALTQAGYTHIDGAAVYKNEPEIGAVYADVFQSINRDQVFITSKLWNTEHHPDRVEAACKQTLHDLQLDYLDLYLMHWGVAFPPESDHDPKDESGKFRIQHIPISDTWGAMEKLVEKGLVKSIGVANFTGMMLHDLLNSSRIQPAMNQVELHPYNSQVELIKYCHQQGIVVTAYSPLGSPGTADPAKPRLLDDEIIVGLADKYGVTASQILISWAISRGTVVIPKSVTPSRIAENIHALDIELSIDDVASINTLNRNLHYVDPSDWWAVPCFK